MINYKFMNLKSVLSAFCILLCLLLSSNSFAQQATVNISPRTLKLRAALEQLEKKAGLNFIYSDLNTELDKTITLSPSALSVNEILIELAKKTGLTFTASGKDITIKQQAKGEVRGKVITAEGKPAQFVSVSLDRLRTTIVDADGNYRFRDIPEGAHTLFVSYIGLESQSREINIKAGTKVSADFTLRESHSELDEVVINGGETNRFSVKKTTTAAKMPLANLDNPQVYTTIPKTLLNEQMITDFSYALKNSPGVYKIQGSRGINTDGASYYSMRGFRTEAALVDGLPSQTNGEIDPSNIERVELIKGPSGTLFGGAVVSFGGLINIVTKKPIDTAGGEISYLTGSFGLNRITADVYGPAKKNSKLLFRMNAAYQYQGSFQDAGFRRTTFFAPAVEYRASNRLTLSLNAGFYQTEATSSSTIFLNRVRKFIATTPEELNFDWKRSYNSNDLTMKNPTVNIKAQINYQISDQWRSQTIYSSNSRKSDGFYQYEFIRGATSDEMLERNISLQNSTNTASDIQQNFIGDFKILGLRNRLIVGLDYLNQTINNNNSPYLVFDNVSGLNPSDPNYVKLSRAAVEARLAASTAAPTKNIGKSNIYSAYASDVLNITNRLLAMLSLRVDRFQNRGTLNQATNTIVTNSKYMQTAVSPKLGLVYHVIKDQVSVFGNYMNGFANVAPVTQPEGAGVSGTFKPQHANQFEAGVKTDLFNGLLSFTASVYDIKVDNLTRNEDLIVGGTTYNITVQNGTQRSKGVELELIANPLKGLNIIAGYSYNDSKLTKATVALEGRRPASAGPATLINSWISYVLPSGELKGLGLGLGTNYVGKHLTSNSAVTGIFTLPSYVMMNATAFYDTGKYRLGFKVDNLTNQLYFTGQGVLSAQMPRAFVANVSYRF
ncbi:TonB-dependent siderophore receptor [Sphingobacteriaceae bacterium GW460-11-11-14-LB5]|nr:TonB-dependent siderophore receptor [Sphingobacteriaceae bacterium GW460-11-11-14-LB5]